MCEKKEILEHANRYECVTCGHEWERAIEPEAAHSPRVVKDAHGNVLVDGDWRHPYQRPKSRWFIRAQTRFESKPIRLVNGDHEVDCKMEGIAVGLKAVCEEGVELPQTFS
jgi:protein PhnA